MSLSLLQPLYRTPHKHHHCNTKRHKLAKIGKDEKGNEIVWNGTRVAFKGKNVVRNYIFGIVGEHGSKGHV
jgi:hypothetical protein